MAIFEAAGRDELEVECSMRFEQAKREGRRLVPGVTVPTLAYNLPAKVILHAIVPKWNPEDPEVSYEDLCKSYASALVMADEMGMESVAFPVLSSGNNGFDADVAIDIALQSLGQYQPKNTLAKAYLVTFDSGITQNMRDRGYEVEDVIDQTYVLGQDVHQAEVRERDRQRHQEAKDRDKPLVQNMIDDAINWLKVPENQKTVLGFALAVATVVVPSKGMGAKVLKVLDTASPYMLGGKK